jgi:prolyl-tRNA synthetase
VGAGDACPRCGTTLRMMRGIEVGHVFKLGTKYSEAFQASFLNEKGQTETMVMGCYGIGVTRTLQAIIEQRHDKDGILWPAAVAPYGVTILLLDPKDAAVTAAADRLAAELEAQGVDVLIDDRDERPGVKFKDADLVGIPIRVVVGAKSLSKGGIEIKLRTEKTSTIVPADQAAARIAGLIQDALSQPRSNVV